MDEFDVKLAPFENFAPDCIVKEETVVIPVSEEYKSSVHKLAEETIRKEIEKQISNARVEMISDNKCRVYVPVGEKGKFIGYQGQRVSSLEDNLGLSIDVVEQDEKKQTKRDERKQILPYQIKIDAKNIIILLRPEEHEKEVKLYETRDCGYGGVCDRLKLHHEILKDDPERLTSDFMIGLICGTEKQERYRSKRGQ